MLKFIGIMNYFQISNCFQTTTTLDCWTIVLTFRYPVRKEVCKQQRPQRSPLPSASNGILVPEHIIMFACSCRLDHIECVLQLLGGLFRVSTWVFYRGEWKELFVSRSLRSLIWKHLERLRGLNRIHKLGSNGGCYDGANLCDKLICQEVLLHLDSKGLWREERQGEDGNHKERYKNG